MAVVTVVIGVVDVAAMVDDDEEEEEEGEERGGVEGRGSWVVGMGFRVYVRM